MKFKLHWKFKKYSFVKIKDTPECLELLKAVQINSIPIEKMLGCKAKVLAIVDNISYKKWVNCDKLVRITEVSMAIDGGYSYRFVVPPECLEVIK